MRRVLQSLALGFFFLSMSAWADKFENIYLSFNLPDGWKCKQEGTEFVCKASTPSNKNHVAVMIMTAKEPGPTDTLAAYTEHLRTLGPTTGATLIKGPVQVNLQGTIWIDATLLGSEIPNFYTRYMATVKGNLAVLYTFSVHKSRYEDFVGVSTLAVQTLQLKPWTPKR